LSRHFPHRLPHFLILLPIALLMRYSQVSHVISATQRYRLDVFNRAFLLWDNLVAPVTYDALGIFDIFLLSLGGLT
jgi:hypothetical protein